MTVKGQENDDSSWVRAGEEAGWIVMEIQNKSCEPNLIGLKGGVIQTRKVSSSWDISSGDVVEPLCISLSKGIESVSTLLVTESSSPTVEKMN